MYQKVFNALEVASVIGVIFICCTLPMLFDSEEEETPQKANLAVTVPSVEVPDVSYVFELKANREKAQKTIEDAQALVDVALGIKLPRMFEVKEEYELSYVGEFYITMYAATVEQCGNDLGITASGRPCSSDPTCWTVAVDPAVIPLGSYLIIDGYDGIVFRADDTGSAINGYDIDIFTESEAESKSFNNQSNVKVWLIVE